MLSLRSDISDDHLLSSVWAFRVLLPLAALCVGLAMLISKNPLHDFFLGLTFGLLVVLSMVSVQLETGACKVTEQPSEVQDPRIT